MTTRVHIFTGQYRTVVVARDKKLKAVVAEQLSPWEILTEAFTSDRSFSSASIPEQAQLGVQEWSLVCNNSDGLAHEVARLSSRVKTLEDSLVSHEQDILVFGANLVRNVAAQVLLFATQDQPRTDPPTRRFQRLSEQGSSQLAQYVQSCPVPPDKNSFVQAADAVINRRNTSVHYSDLNALEQAVTEASALIGRHQGLRQLCKQEAFILDTFQELKAAFNMV